MALGIPVRHHLLSATRPRTLGAAGLILWLLASVACGNTQRESAASAKASAAPYLEPFADFDRWVRRFASADEAFADRARAQEAAFAPLRSARCVRAAWIERKASEPYLLSFVEGAALEEPTREVRLRDEVLGEVRVHRARLRLREGAPRDEVVVLTHENKEGDGTWVVRVAFRVGCQP